MDDIWIGARTQDEAENLLYEYRTVLREYELDINELKTAILPAAKAMPSFWPKELGDLLRSKFMYSVGTLRTKNSDRTFVLDRVFDIANRNNDDGIIKFALRRLDGMRAWRHHWDVLEPFMLRCFVNYPHSVDYVARVLAWRVRIGQRISVIRWREVLNESIALRARLRNDSEVCWGLWLARELGVNVAKGVARLVINNCGPMPLTLLWDCSERGTVRLRPETAVAEERLVH